MLTLELDQRLYQIASQQAGYLTAAQAREAGISRRLLFYHAQQGRLLRIRPDVYRLALFPSSVHEDLFVAWLTVGERAVISHESALSLYELSDALPSEVHLTVPRTTSPRHARLRLHTSALPPEDVTRFAGLPVTTVPRTLADVAVAGLAEQLVVHAIRQAIQRGLTSQEELLHMAARYGERNGRMFHRGLEIAQRDLESAMKAVRAFLEPVLSDQPAGEWALPHGDGAARARRLGEPVSNEFVGPSGMYMGFLLCRESVPFGA
ncbi:MAG: hypothetical protein GX597_25690 [Anaerolineaceae bacterium]|nr:hypothetical protein [Anaerolineaceae bacterium]